MWQLKNFKWSSEFKRSKLPEKCTYSGFVWSVFSRIPTEYGEIRSTSRYSVRMRKNADQKNSVYRLLLRSGNAKLCPCPRIQNFCIKFWIYLFSWIIFSVNSSFGHMIIVLYWLYWFFIITPYKVENTDRGICVLHFIWSDNNIKLKLPCDTI